MEWLSQLGSPVNMHMKYLSETQFGKIEQSEQ